MAAGAAGSTSAEPTQALVVVAILSHPRRVASTLKGAHKQAQGALDEMRESRRLGRCGSRYVVMGWERMERVRTGTRSKVLAHDAVAPSGGVHGRQVRTEASRFGSFLVIGGISTVLNLSVVGALTFVAGWSYLPAAVVALEAGVLLSFVLNDRLTFRTLADDAGSWIQRCLRFHGAYGLGQTLIIGIGFLLIHLAHLPVLVAQAGATAVVTGVNFGVLRMWAYRSRAKFKRSADRRPAPVPVSMLTLPRASLLGGLMDQEPAHSSMLSWRSLADIPTSPLPALGGRQSGLPVSSAVTPRPETVETPRVRANLLLQVPYALAALRPKQWTKNGLVLLALVFAERLTDGTAVVRTGIAFFAFSLAASSIYIINDLGDRERDRAHPKKRNRPIASGKLSVPFAIGVAVLCVLAAVSLSILLTDVTLWNVFAQVLHLRPNPYTNDPAAQWGGSAALFVVVIAGYLLVNVAYTYYLKHAVLWDVFVVASGFVLRAFAGALAIPVPISPWFYFCTLFLALFLALGKRRAELVQLHDAAATHRKILQEYTQPLLDQLMGVVVSCTILTYSLYTFETDTVSHALIMTVPFVIFGVFRYLYLVYVKADGDRPDEILWRDKQIFGAVVLCIIVTLATLYGPALLHGHLVFQLPWLR